VTATAGPADGPAIVFLHGTRLTAGMWSAQQAALSDRYRTVALDLPGHGTRRDEPFSLERAIDAVSATIRDDTADGRAILVGLSLGGYVAMAVAAREPDRVRGLVVSGATIEPVGRAARPFRFFADVLDRVEGDRFHRLNAWSFRVRYPAALADPIIAGGFWAHGGAAALRAIADESFIGRLAAYPGPTLLLNGDRDLPFRTGARRFAAGAHDARRVRLAGAAHLANLDRPAAFSEAIRRFAESLPKG
jgi:pimeloyl-ACP methyl ester carboxylesterase